MQRFLLTALLVLLVACTAQAPPDEKNVPQCAWPEIPYEGACCRDLNENGVCDRIEFAQNISEEEQREYEAAAKQARKTAEKSGTYKRTVVNDLFDSASAVKQYRFTYHGDEVVVANDTIVRKLVQDKGLSVQEINGEKYRVVVNQVTIDFANRKATARCMPLPELVKNNLATPCDNFRGVTFDVRFDDFALKLPIEWLRDFLYRTPYEALPGQHIRTQTATLYRFTDLKDAEHNTNLWLDTATNMPLRVEVWQNEQLVRHEDYSDLYSI